MLEFHASVSSIQGCILRLALEDEDPPFVVTGPMDAVAFRLRAS